MAFDYSNCIEVNGMKIYKSKTMFKNCFIDVEESKNGFIAIRPPKNTNDKSLIYIKHTHVIYISIDQKYKDKLAQVLKGSKTRVMATVKGNE